jgi:hypothetical protein
MTTGEPGAGTIGRGWRVWPVGNSFVGESIGVGFKVSGKQSWGPVHHGVAGTASHWAVLGEEGAHFKRCYASPRKDWNFV